jgi:hypothetical protein
MADFLSPLRVQLLPENPDCVRWMVIDPLKYQSDVMGRVIEVPTGFITDFVSFEPLKNVGHRAAVVHDYLYSCADVDRETADKVLSEALGVCGVNGLLAEDMYAAVRLFGGGHKDSTYLLGPVE